MNLHQRFRVCVYTLVLLSFCAFSLAEGNPVIMILGVLATGLSWVFVERPGRGVPRWMINVGVLLSSLLLFWELVLNVEEPNLLRSLAHFMSAILACKLFEHKSSRDFSQILTLSLLVIVTGAIFTTSIVFAVMLVAYLGLGLYAILLFHLRTEFAANAPGGAAPRVSGRGGRAAGETPVDPSLRRDIRFITATAAFALFLAAAAIFLIFPRNKGRELFANLAFNRNPVSGFSDRVVMMNDFGRIQTSNAIAMEVELTDHDGVNIGSPNVPGYFRGATFDHYDYTSHPIQWKHSEVPRMDEDAQKPAFAVDPMRYDENLLETQKITLYPIAGFTLFAMGPAVRVAGDDLHGITQNPHDRTLAYGPPTVERQVYYVDTPSIFQPEANPLAESYREAMGKQEIPPVVAEKAREAISGLFPGDSVPSSPTPDQSYKIAERIEDYLRKNYAYSLETKRVENIDPVSDFLKNRQSIGGHCEYFAASMVLMCDALHIPARLVTGYHGGDFNSIDNVYTIRQRHAHAWVEVFTSKPEWKGKLGWVTFDPTPAGDSTTSGLDSWTIWMKELFQVVDRTWNATIASFDNTSREALGNAIVQTGENWLMNFSAFTLATVHNKARSGMYIVLFIVGCWVFHRWTKRRASEALLGIRHLSRAKRKELVAELVFFEQLMVVLRRTGIRRATDQTPREFATMASQNVASIRPDALWVIDRFYEIRFGTGKSSPQLQADISQRLERMRLAIRHAR